MRNQQIRAVQRQESVRVHGADRTVRDKAVHQLRFCPVKPLRRRLLKFAGPQIALRRLQPVRPDVAAAQNRFRPRLRRGGEQFRVIAGHNAERPLRVAGERQMRTGVDLIEQRAVGRRNSGLDGAVAASRLLGGAVRAHRPVNDRGTGVRLRAAH